MEGISQLNLTTPTSAYLLHLVSLAAFGTAHGFGSITATLAPTILPILTTQCQRFSADAAGRYAIVGETLTPGGDITF